MPQPTASTTSNEAPLTEPVEDDMTVDQIAQHAQIPVSTVRMYQHKGLLPKPERRGRVGYYNAGHRDRLRLIAHLQDRGFSLAAIKEALDSWNAGRSLDHLLGVSSVAPSLGREPRRMTPAELAKRFKGVGITQADIQRAVEIGLVELDGTEVLLASDAFGDIGPAVAQLGVPLSEILDEYEALRESVGHIAERFRTVFERHLWDPFVERGMLADEIPTLTVDVGQLTELATSVVTVELHRRFAAFTADYVAEAEASLKDQ